ncbi:MAG: hypothetical protein V3V28_05460 [Polaribacter sp.]|uniref:hypothetical protein n=1 Tax=Polaribacter sp. TaxID=1920175 RepID=UPI002F35E26D
MELANIERLVEKYLNAETSLQEEATLKNYFTEGNVAPHLQEYEYMFNYFAVSKDETFTKTIQLEPKKSKRRNLKWLSVVASVVLLFSVFIGNNQYKKHQAEKQFAQVSNALKMLSNNLQKGEQAVATLYTYENTVNKILK